jgi:hypothetical protein
VFPLCITVGALYSLAVNSSLIIPTYYNAVGAMDRFNMYS